MEILDVIERVRSSDIFKDWDSKNPGFYLSHVFVMCEDEENPVFQVGFYSEKLEKAVTFIDKGSDIDVEPTQDVFKKPGSSIPELDLDSIKLDWKMALHKASKFKDEKHPNEMVIKSFFILQTLDIGTVYNLTFVTKTFNTLNIKLSAGDGKVLKHELISLMELGKFQKGEKN